MYGAQLRAAQLRSRQHRDELIRSRFTSVGSYPLFAVTHDGAALCQSCCINEHSSIGFTTGTDGWAIDCLAVNWEDPELYCDHCGSRIESAYAEGEVMA